MTSKYSEWASLAALRKDAKVVFDDPLARQEFINFPYRKLIPMLVSWVIYSGALNDKTTIS